MTAKLILFDVDGTLVDVAGAGRRSLEEAFRRVLGVDDISAVASEVRFEGKTDPLIVAEMARASGLDARQARDALPGILRAYVDALREELNRPDPRRRVLNGVLPLLEVLARTPGVHLGLLTGNIELGARAKLGVFDLNRYFPGGGFSSDDPDRRVIARLAREKISRQIGVPLEPAHVTVVGDTVYDVDCARANGYRAVAVPHLWQPAEQLAASRPDVLLPNLGDLAAALAALGLPPSPTPNTEP